jgi:hypothetical protein
MPKKSAVRVAPPTPLLGRYRYVALLPAGAGARLSFDGACVELGNGWVDLSARLAEAPADAWLPAALVGRRGDGGELLGELLRPHAGSPTHMLAIREGDLVRELPHDPREPFGYWLRASAAWHPVQRLDLPAPRPDEPDLTVDEPDLTVDEPDLTVDEHLSATAPG